jgi:putative transposase
MARLARLSIAGQPHLIGLRGAGGDEVLRAEDDFRFFLQCLRDAAVRKHIAVHAYVLMPDCVHLLATPGDVDAISRAIQSVGRRYVRWFNKRYARAGALWDGRYRSAVIEAEPYLLDCCRFIETLPQRAGLIADAASYPWSSLRHHLGISSDPILTDHPIAWALGNTPFDRQSAYRALVERPLALATVERFERTMISGRPLGTAAFLLELELQCKRTLSPRARGRPRRADSARQKGKSHK